VSSTIGVQHQDDGLRAMQAHGLTNLFQDKLAITFMFGRRQAFCSSGYADGIGIEHPNALQQLAERGLKTIVVAPYYGGITSVFLTRGGEMQYLAHGLSSFGLC